jgi:hypothetical protein
VQGCTAKAFTAITQVITAEAGWKRCDKQQHYNLARKQSKKKQTPSDCVHASAAFLLQFRCSSAVKRDSSCECIQKVDMNFKKHSASYTMTTIVNMIEGMWQLLPCEERGCGETAGRTGKGVDIAVLHACAVFTL